MALSWDNRHVATGCTDGIVTIHSIDSKTELARADNVIAGGVSGLSFLRDDSGLVACGFAGVLEVYSTSLELVQILLGHDDEGEVFCVTVSPSGSHLVSSGEDNLIIWGKKGKSGKWKRVKRGKFGSYTRFSRAVCFSPDGKLLATGCYGDLFTYDLDIILYSFNEGIAVLAHTLKGHTNAVLSLSFSPDCKLLCSGSNDKSIKF